jgi:hypothetical protein
MPRQAADTARSRAQELVARIAADLDGPLTPTVLDAAIAEVVDALAHDLAVDAAESRACERAHFANDVGAHRQTNYPEGKPCRPVVSADVVAVPDADLEVRRAGTGEQVG